MTRIPGKDAPLEATITRLTDQLAALGFHIEERSWLHPIAGVWSVHIRDRDCPLLFTNGKGASREAALASALGEFFERLSTRYFWTHYFLGQTRSVAPVVHQANERWFMIPDDHDWPDGLLDEDLREFYNPDGDLDVSTLVDRNSGNSARGICALPFIRHDDGATIWFPVNLLGNLYVSNGMSAGNTADEARVQALSELAERYVKFEVIREGLCLPDIPEEVLKTFPLIWQGIEELRAAGFGILIKDASLGGIWPVINVTLLNPADQGCFASFGAHPLFEVALERALTELLQGRGLDALTGFHAPGFDMDEIADPQNLEIHFVDSSGIISWEFLSREPDFDWNGWHFNGDNTDAFNWLTRLIENQGYRIYIGDYTDLGVYACRILIPGLSEIYPVEELSWDNNSSANDLRPQVLNLASLNEQDCLQLIDDIDERGIADQQPVAGWLGLAADPGSVWKELRIGELKTLLAMAGGDREAALAGCEWIRQFEHIPPQRQRVYRAVATLLQMEDASLYQPALDHLFDAATVVQAQALINKSERFFGLDSPGMDLAGCQLHQRLLEALKKLDT